MTKLLLLADDITGALDSGVQFANKGATVAVTTETGPDLTSRQPNPQVLVVVTETRHLPPAEAHDVVLEAVRRAAAATIPYIYKKTDSALRGNVGAELAAALEGSGRATLHFLPAFPKMNRVTRDGIHYIDGCPVAESPFGRDPFNPVRHSGVARLIAEQTGLPTIAHGLPPRPGTLDAPGLHVYDIASDEDFRVASRLLGPDRLRLSAGCAGFAEILAGVLGLTGQPPALPRLAAPLFIVCGSVHPVTSRQLATAEQAGFTRVHLSPAQLLGQGWPSSPEGRDQTATWLRMAGERGAFIVDTLNQADPQAVERRAASRGLATGLMRARIAETLGALMKNLLDGGFTGSLFCTGGDVLLALMRQLGAREMTPLGELAPGVVLGEFTYRGRPHRIIAKSGGFGAADLLTRLKEKI